MIEAPAAASSRGGIPLTAPSVPTGMKAGVSTTPWGVESRPRRAAPHLATTSNVRGMKTSPPTPLPSPPRRPGEGRHLPALASKDHPSSPPLPGEGGTMGEGGRGGEVSRLRLRLAAEVDHPGLDPLGDLEHIAVLGDAAVPLEVLEAVLHGVAVSLDIEQMDGQEGRVVDPQGHRLEALGDPLEAGGQLQAVRLALLARGAELHVEVLEERLHVAARSQILEHLVRVAADLDQLGAIQVAVPGGHLLAADDHRDRIG